MAKMKSPIGDRLKRYHGEAWHTPQGKLIRDVVYAIDTGLITTVSFMAGVSVSLPTRETVLLAGLVQVIAGTLAIFFGAYISTKAQKDFFENQIERERRELEEMPEKEKQEIRDIFSEMGFREEELETAVERITADKETWLKFMVQEEIGVIPGTIDNPLLIGGISTVSFLIGATPAIAPFLLGLPTFNALLLSAGFVLVFLFILGVVKSRLTKVFWIWSGLETLVVGGVSCGLGFLLGRLVSGAFQ